MVVYTEKKLHEAGNMTEKQKDVFLKSEGDAWFDRNHLAINKYQFGEDDRVIRAIDLCLQSSMDSGASRKLLEIGCGEGGRLQWLSECRGIECSGVDPSEKAVCLARERGLDAIKGTADQLPFGDNEFDFVVFGFCLYLCDRDDLFSISKEADRVLRDSGWLIIMDFFADAPIKRPYHHLSGVYSYKMDYRKLWDWHPAYTCFSHTVTHHVSSEFCDDINEWVAVSVLRKRTMS